MNENFTKQIKSLTRIRIHPQHLNHSIIDHIEEKLLSKLNNKWTQQFGFLTDVQMLPMTSPGRVDTKSGFTEFLIEFCATANKPHIGQLVSAAIVTNVTKLGVHFQCGPLTFFTHEKMIPSTYTFSNNMYKCQKTGATLKRGDERNLKIVGTSWTDNCYVSCVFFVLLLL